MADDIHKHLKHNEIQAIATYGNTFHDLIKPRHGAAKLRLRLNGRASTPQSPCHRRLNDRPLRHNRLPIAAQTPSRSTCITARRRQAAGFSGGTGGTIFLRHALTTVKCFYFLLSFFTRAFLSTSTRIQYPPMTDRARKPTQRPVLVSCQSDIGTRLSVSLM